MSRIELELYADRVARNAERLRDDVDGARLRLAWAGIEGRVRTELGAHDAAVLEALGVLVAVDAASERRRAGVAAGTQLSPVPFISGASDASMPPSSS